jgi:hypothetical protein
VTMRNLQVTPAACNAWQTVNVDGTWEREVFRGSLQEAAQANISGVSERVRCGMARLDASSYTNE